MVGICYAMRMRLHDNISVSIDTFFADGGRNRKNLVIKSKNIFKELLKMVFFYYLLERFLNIR